MNNTTTDTLSAFLSFVNSPWIQGLIIEILGGIIFLFVILVLLRPSFEISSEIAKYEERNRSCYAIKIVNKSIFQAFDIYAQVSSLSYSPAQPSGTNKTLQPVALTLSNIPHLPNRFNKENDHAVWFRTFENIETILNDPNACIQIKVTMKHGLTGLSRIKFVTYTASSLIKSGRFESGNSLKIC